MEKFEEKFNSFLASVVELLNKHQKHVNYFQNIEVKDGKRYKKIIVGFGVWCFVDKTTGDVLKAASFSTPAKHARGNIFDAHNGVEHITVYGPKYLR